LVLFWLYLFLPGFILALFVSTNGVLALIEGFNKTIMHEKRKGWNQRLVALYLTILLATLLIIAILLIIITEVILHYFNNHILNLNQNSVYLLLAGKYLILILLCFTAISSLYFFGPSGGSKKWHFFSPGSILATILIAVTSIAILIAVTSIAFNFFILNFGQYNKIYGSIGTLIVILIYLNFNCIQLLIGFELNNAIEKAKFKPNTEEIKS